MNYNNVVHYLENLTIMPKTMPGLEKIRMAIQAKSWFKDLNPKKIITVAGTNGKGTTAAALEALLLSAGKTVGLYTSPHLVTTSERIRLNGLDISQTDFVNIFLDNKSIIEQHQLSHFESLTLMASDYFFNKIHKRALDFVILEVGLGGLYDATNIFPNHYSILTTISLDHENILGNNLISIAQNKFGIVKPFSQVVHHKLNSELSGLIETTKLSTESIWLMARSYIFKTNLIGPRAVENINTAITMFSHLGFDFEKHKSALLNIRWPGRMQKVDIKSILCPVYLSGDHNSQGVDSLVEILKSFKYENIHIIVGIGVDKSCSEMLDKLLKLKNIKLYLTETPFKGRSIDNYPEHTKSVAVLSDKNITNILSQMKTHQNDLVVITGSLYLVGFVLSIL